MSIQVMLITVYFEGLHNRNTIRELFIRGCRSGGDNGTQLIELHECLCGMESKTFGTGVGLWELQLSLFWPLK